MDFYDIIETLDTWISLYRQSSESDKNSEKWKRNMVRIISKLNVPDEFLNTPFAGLLDEAIKLAREDKVEKINKIYENISRLEHFLKAQIKRNDFI